MTEDKARRFLTAMASLAEGVVFVDTEDFVGFEGRHASGKVRRWGGSGTSDSPYARTFKMVSDSRNTCPSWYRRHFSKVPEFASEEELEFKLSAMGKDLGCL